jgi:hypothetical protein
MAVEPRYVQYFPVLKTKNFLIVSDFGTSGEIYILSCSKMACPDVGGDEK